MVSWTPLKKTLNKVFRSVGNSWHLCIEAKHCELLTRLSLCLTEQSHLQNSVNSSFLTLRATCFSLFFLALSQYLHRSFSIFFLLFLNISLARSFLIFSLLEIAFHLQQISRLLPSRDKIGCCVFSQTQLLFGQECVCDFYCRFYVSCSANLPLSILWHSWFASFSARYVCIDTKVRLLFYENKSFQMQNCHHKSILDTLYPCRNPSNCPQNNF